MPSVCDCLGFFFSDFLPLHFYHLIDKYNEICWQPPSDTSAAVYYQLETVTFRLGNLKKSLIFQVPFLRQYTKTEVFWS